MRQNCPHCRRPQHYCYCSLIQKIETPITFAILIHHLEARRKIATGRMAHLCLKDSHLIRGDDFTHNDEVNQLIEDSNNHCLLLYPGANALNLSDPAFSEKREALIHPSKKTILFIVDGTWSSVRKTIRLSENLRRLPTFCFTPQYTLSIPHSQTTGTRMLFHNRSHPPHTRTLG